MYERFTDRARKVMQLANQEAQRVGHAYIGTEHILLGLVKEGFGVAANVLKNLDVDLQRVRREVQRIVLPVAEPHSLGKLPQSPRAKKVIEYAIDAAKALHHNFVGSEHLLLGLLGVREGIASQVLTRLGLELKSVREEVMALVGPGPEEGPHALGAEDGAGLSLDLPVGVRKAIEDLDTEIKRLCGEKEAAIAEDNFQKAAARLDQERKVRRHRVALLRNWQSTRTVDPAWLSWNDSVVPRLARAIREARKWEDLPVLADALEEAGCTDWEMLSHCRGTLRHGTGCWVIDLLLGAG